MHLGLFLKNKLVGICSFFYNSNRNIAKIHQYQLRGMAILNEYQGKGFGNIILKHGEHLLKEKKTKIIWCNAREGAVTFYKKNGYKIIGDSFNVKSIGVHYIMYKTL